MNGNIITSYIQAGFYLIPIPAGQKGPNHAHWNVRTDQPFPLDWTGNIGLGLRYCRDPLGDLDVDDLFGTRQWMQGRGLDLDKYLNAPDAVQIVSGRDNRAKLLYRMPMWCDWLRTRKISEGGKTLFEFRSATKSGLTVQDVIPPSIHPDTGKPYTWRGDYTNIPEIPPELLALWMELVKPRERSVHGSSLSVRTDTSFAEVQSALEFINPDLPRDDWIKVGMALHDFDPDAEELFDQWSAKGFKYKGTDIAPVWDSFDASPDGITVATLFRYARDAGWTGYIVPIEQVFGEPGSPVETQPQPPQPVRQFPYEGGGTPVVETLQGAEVVVNVAADLRREIRGLPPFVFGDESLTQPIADILLRSLVLSQADQIGIQELVHGHTGWNRKQMDSVLKEARKRQRKLMGKGGSLGQVTSEYLYIANLHLFLHRPSGEMLKPEAFIALNQHISEELKDVVMGGEGVPKVFGLDFDPSQGQYFMRDKAEYYNQWTGLADYGTPGDYNPWLTHLEQLIPTDWERDHLLDWMAFTLQHPGTKINHAVIFNGSPGVGKDFIFWPLCKAMGKHSRHIQAGTLLSDFNDYLNETKLLVVQEPDLGNHTLASRIANNLKSVVAAPPEEIIINRKGVPGFPIMNICAIAALTNEPDPVLISNDDRRYFVLETALRVTGPDHRPLPDWADYFKGLWGWMEDQGGWRHVVHYLMNRDLKDFSPKAPPPLTQAKLDVIDASVSEFGGMLSDLYYRAVGPFGLEITTVQQVQEWFQTAEGVGTLATHGFKDLPSSKQLGRGIKQYCYSQVVRRRIPEQTRVHILRNVGEWMRREPDEFKEYLDANSAWIPR